MMQYGIRDLKVERFTAKISMSNEPSITLFKKLGFEVRKAHVSTSHSRCLLIAQVESESKVFKETTLALDVTEGSAGRTAVLGGFGIPQCSRETFCTTPKTT